MPYTQHFIIEGKHLGTSERNRQFTHGESQAPDSVAFFCPKCAEVWARAMIEGRGYCEVRTMICRKHPPTRYSVPGSLTCEWDKEFVEAFPAGVVAWELQQHLTYYEGTRE